METIGNRDVHEPVIKMTYPMRWLADYLAHVRNDDKRDNSFSHRTSFEAHTIGLLAEVAVSHRWNVPLNCEKYADGDRGPDIVIGGRCVAVKCTTYWDDPLLRVELDQFIPGHIYFCTAAQGDSVKLVGWTTSDIVEKSPQSKFLKDGPMNYVVKREDLYPFKPMPADSNLKPLDI